MSTEPVGVESDSVAVFGADASRSENEMAHKSETLADSEAQDLVVKLTEAERRGCVSAGDEETETRNGFCDLKKKTESVVGSGKQESKPENLNGVVLTGSASATLTLKLSEPDLVYKEKVRSHDDNLCKGVDFDAEFEDIGDDRDKQEPKSENLKQSDSDLVWAKVRSYPWWPGQVFNSSAASSKAKKFYKKGKSLIMYFGDCTFAWNDSTRIKPFHQFFSQMVNQSKTTEFRNAVDCALEEVSRRVEFGLSCSCISKEAYNNLKTQKIMNPGVREDSFVRNGGDKLSNAAFFKPVRVLEYLKHLACFSSYEYDATDKLWFVTNRARLLAFQEWQSSVTFPKYETFLKSLESEASIPEEPSSKKRKTGYKDNEEDKERFGIEDKSDEKSKKKKTLLEFIAEKRSEKSDSEKKRKAESLESGKNKKMESSINNDPWNYENLLKELSCSSNLNGESKKTSVIITETSSETDEMISSLHNVKTRMEIIPESSISIDHSNYEDFEKFVKDCSNLNDDDFIKLTTGASESMNVQTSLNNITDSGGLKDSSEEQTGLIDITGSGSKDQIGLKDSSEEQTGLEDNTGSGSKDQTDPEDQTGVKDMITSSNSKEALILNFADSGSVPTVEKLNKIFSRYGTLIESETKLINKNGKRARVVFERSEDAKTAFSSAGKYSIFGPSLLSYKLKFVCIKTKQSKKKMTKT